MSRGFFVLFLFIGWAAAFAPPHDHTSLAVALVVAGAVVGVVLGVLIAIHYVVECRQ